MRSRAWQAGADDYITKPFGLAELRSRIRAVLRRAHGHLLDDGLLEIGNVVLDQRQREVSVDDKPVRLTFAEFELLQCLMAKPGRLQEPPGAAAGDLGRQRLPRPARDRRAHPPPAREARRAATGPKLILTVRGAGYRFRDRREWRCAPACCWPCWRRAR